MNALKKQESINTEPGKKQLSFFKIAIENLMNFNNTLNK